ncbi:MAG: NAD(P)-dependent oxidoreductase [Gammaproteobacteria bacterium]|nr:NAD(P)-dependent oxidoreductase [Gammaproteobacteria bacterium]
MASSFAPPDRIGFIGLGNMGVPMARRLAGAGYALAVADRNPDAVKRFAAEVRCEQPADLKTLGSLCRVVITMLPEGKAVRDVLTGPRGVVAGLKPGSVLIDMTSASPVSTRELGEELAKQGFPLIDAPVSGGVKKAVEGTLSIMAGGDAAVLERVRPILDVMGKVFHTGASGSGHAMKSLNNYLSAATLTASAEAIIAGAKFGLDPKLMVDILNVSTGRSNSTEYKYPVFILPGTFNSGFALGLMAKDLRLALELAKSTGAPHMLLEECAHTWAEAETQLGFGADHTEVVKYLESLADGKAKD